MNPSRVCSSDRRELDHLGQLATEDAVLGLQILDLGEQFTFGRTHDELEQPKATSVRFPFLWCCIAGFGTPSPTPGNQVSQSTIRRTLK